jgi:hypothetical protein
LLFLALSIQKTSLYGQFGWCFGTEVLAAKLQRIKCLRALGGQLTSLLAG